MPPKRLFTFAITDDLKALLQKVKSREGISEAEQIRRGLRLWFKSKGYGAALQAALAKAAELKRRAEALEELQGRPPKRKGGARRK